MGHFDQPVTLGNASQHVVHAGDSFSLRIVQLTSNPVAKGRKLPRPHRALMLSIACISAAGFLSRSGSAKRLDWRLRSGRRPRYVALCLCEPIFVRLNVKCWPHFRCHRPIPGSIVRVVTNFAPRMWVPTCFGLIPSWAKDAKIARSTYNARTEMVGDPYRRCVGRLAQVQVWRRGQRHAHGSWARVTLSILLAREDRTR